MLQASMLLLLLLLLCGATSRVMRENGLAGRLQNHPDHGMTECPLADQLCCCCCCCCCCVVVAVVASMRPALQQMQQQSH